MKQGKYKLSFISGGLFLGDSIKLASLYNELQDWDLVKAEVLKGNILQSRTLKTAKTFSREIVSRLQTLTEQQLELLIQGTRQEQNLLLWIAVCKRYDFIKEFAMEVLKENYLCLNLELKYETYERFFTSKAQWHEELDNLTDLTKKKIKQILFKILKEAELLTSDHIILSPIISTDLNEVLKMDHFPCSAVLPIAEVDVKDGLACHK